MRLRLSPFEEASLGEALGLASAALRAAERHHEPVLVTSLVSGGGAVLGALQRRGSLPTTALSRLTTGPGAFVPGRAFHHAFALPALTTVVSDATPRNLLNRHVRGFLRGYAALGAPAQYFGREYFCLSRRPFGLIAYDVTASGAVLFEVLAGVDAPVLEPSGDSKAVPVAVAEAIGTADPAALAGSIHQGIATKWALEPVIERLEPEALPSRHDTPGEYVRRRVPIGWLEALASVDGEAAQVRLAGDLLCSRAAANALESRAAAALLAGRDVDDTVLAPLAEGPIDGATLTDVQAVLREALERARSSL